METKPSGTDDLFDVNGFLRKTLAHYSESEASQMLSCSAPLLRTEKTSVCPYCGVKTPSASNRYCSDCLLLARNSPEVSRRLLDQSVVKKSSAEPSVVRKVSLSPSLNSNCPTCRICQLPSLKEDRLLSPCRCAGSLQYVHISCLVRWLEISAGRKCWATPKCELCGYHYKCRSCFTADFPIYTPHCSHKDVILHCVFALMVVVMVGCVILSCLYLQGDRGIRSRSSLTVEDIVVICCSILFICALLVGGYAEYRSDQSLFALLFRLCLVNRLWRIQDYLPPGGKAEDL